MSSGIINLRLLQLIFYYASLTLRALDGFPSDKNQEIRMLVKFIFVYRALNNILNEGDSKRQ